MSWVKGKPKGHRTPPIDRLLARTIEDEETGCWVFQGTTHTAGYGIVSAGGRNSRMLYAHRVTYEHFIGDIPGGLVIDHLCRNRRCCNPWHLQPVPHRVNLLRGVGPSARAAATHTCPNGHAYDDVNTYRNPRTGQRTCRACHRDYARARRAQAKGGTA